MQKHNQADIAVVLGSMVHYEGRPSKQLKARLDTAYELYKKNCYKTIIVSGGLDPRGNDEALVMRNYLVKKGIPKQNIIMDNQGNNTRATATNLKNIIQNNKLLNDFKTEKQPSVAIISQFFHLPRTKLTFEQEGFKVNTTAYPKSFFARDLYSIAREGVAYPAYLFKIR
ncbi:YdcF family protein [Desulfovibrio litoralis]|nr:YdcF family protein [Desulfovibrio litoralis]